MCSYKKTFPRADVFLFIAAGCTSSSAPVAARAALHDLLELTAKIPETHRTTYLVTAADLYMRLGDKPAMRWLVPRLRMNLGHDGAHGSFELSFASAQDLFTHDLDSYWSEKSSSRTLARRRSLPSLRHSWRVRVPR